MLRRGDDDRLEMLAAPRNAPTTGAILMASGRVPITTAIRLRPPESICAGLFVTATSPHR